MKRWNMPEKVEYAREGKIYLKKVQMKYTSKGEICQKRCIIPKT